MTAPKPVDTCDRCGARAVVDVHIKAKHALPFCQHHFNENEEALSKIEGVIFLSDIPEPAAASA